MDEQRAEGGRGCFVLKSNIINPNNRVVVVAGEGEITFRLACFHVLTKSCDRAIVNLFIHLEEKLRLRSRFAPVSAAAP